MPEPTMEDYSRALDEIYSLRSALAYEAEVLALHLEYASFPKSRRRFAEAQLYRMRNAARGRAEFAYREVKRRNLQLALIAAGAKETLTRSEWEAERVGRP